MHDLLLFGQIPESRFAQLAEILAGLTALPEPRPILERRYIFRPNRAPAHKVEQLGASQNITDTRKAAARKQKAEDEARYCTLIEDLTLKGHSSGTDEAAETARLRFALHVTDVPEPEIKSVMTQARTVTEIKGDNVLASVEARGQRYVHQYGVEGRQFVLNNVVIRLQRCMELVPIEDQAQSGPMVPISEFRMKPWDKSGGYMIQAAVTLTDGKNPELVSRGTEQLKRLKEDLRGCVELRTVERLSMDPRAK